MNKTLPDVTDIKVDDLVKKDSIFETNLRVLIKNKAYINIINQLSSSLEKEMGGVLIGNIYKDNIGPYLEISDIIEATNSDSTISSLTFTSDTWSNISQTRERKYPEEKIVGWYHSHPGHSVFLSDQDLFIQKNFFNIPWQIAFVFDPTTGDEAVFVWNKGNPKPIDIFWVDLKPHFRKYTTEKAMPHDIKIKTLEMQPENKEPIDNRRIKPWIGILYAFIFVLLIGNVFLNNKVNSILKIASFLKSNISSNPSVVREKPEIEAQIDLSHIEYILDNAANLAGCQIDIKQIDQSLLCSGIIFSNSQKSIIDSIIRTVANDVCIDMHRIQTIPYVTKRGDNLSKIAGIIYGQSDNWRVIHAANKSMIENPDSIPTGIGLTIP